MLAERHGGMHDKIKTTLRVKSTVVKIRTLLERGKEHGHGNWKKRLFIALVT